MIEIARDWLTANGVSPSFAEIIGWVIVALAIILLAFLANLLAKKILLSAVTYVVRRSKTKWDDALLEHRVFLRLSHIAPALVIYFTAALFEPVTPYLHRFSLVYMALAGLSAFNAFLNTVVTIYETYDMSRQKPIKGYIQVVKIIFFIIVGILALATLMGQPPWALLTGLGAMTAVLILVFKDSILGLVAGVQLSANDMIRIGDWIEMPKFGADGDVIDVSLHTVKVQNWDKTISSIPAYSLISDSFKNWRGMSESGGRRIKRSIIIDINSIKFCDAEMLSRFERVQLLNDYITSRRREVADYNAAHEVDTSLLINGRNLTNIGTFRAYIVAYLKQHPKIHDTMTFLVRQLPPGEHGLPLEIYVFSNDQVWANYEAIQADIFDHLLAVVPMFDLRVFQQPSGRDVQAALSSLPPSR